MSKPIEEHLADFLRLMSGEGMANYRKRCTLLWKDRYGEEIARKAWVLAKSPGKGSAKPAANGSIR